MTSPRPNILVVFPDQWRPDWNPANGTLPLRLPNLKQLQADGTRFTRAITSSPLCAPSRACFALGLDYDACPVKNNEMNLPLDCETFYTKLRTAGYHVLGCGKMDLAKAANDWGIDGVHPMPGGRNKIGAWGFSAAVDNSGKLDGFHEAKRNNLCPHTHFLKDHELLQVHLADYAKRMEHNSYRNTAPTPLPDFGYADNFEGEQGMALLHKVPVGEPWFLQVNFSGPHDPEDVTQNMWDGWQEAQFPPPVNGAPGLSAQEHNSVRRNYAAMLENIDRWLGHFREGIKKRGETDRTIVVFSSDHGEMLGDHHLWGKKVPFHASMGIPMVVAGPGVRPNAENSSPVTLCDLAATCLDAAGGGKGITYNSGHSLLPVLQGTSSAVRQVAISGLGAWRAAFDGRWKYVRNYDPAPALYDLENDPNELTNVAAANPDVVTRLAACLPAAPAGVVPAVAAAGKEDS